nr:site-specific integrase [Mycolicibacterium fortuitum subsp. fortuitum DSM 46621 = ATCC 6841 = JCM 6387]
MWFERQGQPVGVGRSTRTISRRLRRALEHRDRCCVVPGCGATRWGFGYEPDKLTIRESEAAVVRELMARVIAGENVHELTMWLNTTQVPTVRGGPWSTTALRGILSSPRIAGLRAYRGEVIGPGI